MNDHDCHAMDKPILGCQLLNKEILYSDYFNVKTSRFNWFNFQKFDKNRCFYSKIHQESEFFVPKSITNVIKSRFKGIPGKIFWSKFWSKLPS